MSYTFEEALGGIRRSPLLTTLSAAMIALSLFVLGLFGIAAHNIRHTIEYVEERVEIVAYLRDDASENTVNTVREDLVANPKVLEVDYVSRQEALELARQTMPELHDLVDDMEVNPLPASIAIRMAPGHRTPGEVASIAELVSAYPFVEDVEYGHAWLEKIFLLRRIAGLGALVLGGAFFGVATLIIGAAVRMSIFARREEIGIMRLVGATNSFIRRPFLLEGLITGLLGGAGALGLTYAAYRVMWQTVFQLEWLPDLWLMAGIGAGGVLGLLAAGLAVRHYLTEI